MRFDMTKKGNAELQNRSRYSQVEVKLYSGETKMQKSKKFIDRAKITALSQERVKITQD